MTTNTIQTITPALAQHMLETMIYERQRNINQARVDEYAHEMSAGRFIPFTQIRIAHTANGSSVILDGQHRLWAVVLSNTSQQFSVLETCEDNEQAIAWAYSNIDIGQPRNASAIIRSFDLVDELGLTHGHLTRMKQCASFLASGGDVHKTKRAPNRAFLLELLRLYAPHMRPFFDLYKTDSIRTTVVRASTLSLAMLTYRFPFRAGNIVTHDFWSGLCADDGLVRDDPRKAAHTHLVNTRITSTRATSANGIQKVTPNYSFRYLINCYNAYMQNRPLGKTYVRNENAPVIILGVPTSVEKWIK